MKWILIAVLVGLIVGQGGRRLRELFSTTKRLPDEFRKGKAAALDPVSVAKDVDGRVK